MNVLPVEASGKHPVATLNSGWWSAFLLVVLVHTQGCAPLLAIGSAVGFGVTYYQSNVVERTFTNDLPRVWDASLRALDGMAIAVGEKQQEGCRAEIQAVTQDLKVEIVLTAITPIVTRVSVDVGKPNLLRDAATAKEIVEQISRDLGEGRARKTVQKSEFKAGDLTCQISSPNGSSASMAKTSPGQAVEFIEIKALAGNVRAAASTDSKIVATLPRGTKLEKIDHASDWVKVRLSNGTEGFIHPRLVQAVRASPPSAPDISGVPRLSILPVEYKGTR